MVTVMLAVSGGIARRLSLSPIPLYLLAGLALATAASSRSRRPNSSSRPAHRSGCSAADRRPGVLGRRVRRQPQAPRARWMFPDIRVAGRRRCGVHPSRGDRVPVPAGHGDLPVPGHEAGDVGCLHHTVRAPTGRSHARRSGCAPGRARRGRARSPAPDPGRRTGTEPSSASRCRRRRRAGARRRPPAVPGACGPGTARPCRTPRRSPSRCRRRAPRAGWQGR